MFIIGYQHRLNNPIWVPATESSYIHSCAFVYTNANPFRMFGVWAPLYRGYMWKSYLFFSPIRRATLQDDFTCKLISGSVCIFCKFFALVKCLNLLLSISTNGAARFNISIRPMNCYQLESIQVYFSWKTGDWGSVPPSFLIPVPGFPLGKEPGSTDSEAVGKVVKPHSCLFEVSISNSFSYFI